MRLVSDAIYNKLFSNIEGDPTTHLANEKTEILNDSKIPDEMKPQLYHQAVRNVNNKIQEEAAKPLPISHESLDEEVFSADDKNRRRMLDNWFKVNGIVQLSATRVLIDNKSETGKFPYIRRWLLGDRTFKKPDSVDLVIDKLTNAGLPKNFFERHQSGSGAKKNNPRRSKSLNCGCGIKQNNGRHQNTSCGCGMKKIKKFPKIKIQWKKY
jgi:hypothetical protein